MGHMTREMIGPSAWPLILFEVLFWGEKRRKYCPFLFWYRLLRFLLQHRKFPWKLQEALK